jgi:hypothetical protein
LGCRAVAIQSITIFSNSSVVFPTGDGHHFQQPLFAGRRDGFHVAFENTLEGLLLFPLRVLRRKRLDAIECEGDLEVTPAAPTSACHRCRTSRFAQRAGRNPHHPVE